MSQSSPDLAWWDPTVPARRHAVAARFHATAVPTGHLPQCRSDHIRALEAWLAQRDTAGGGAIHVTGPPGTGKTLAVTALTGPIILLNCMRFPEPRHLLEALVAALPCQTAAADPMQALRQAAFAGGDARLAVVLDELDALLASRAGAAILAEMLALAHAPRSRLALIAVSNAVDPRIAIHDVVVFTAYTSQEIATLLHERLATLPGPVFQPAAISLCARAIANGTGDMRRALEACGTALAIHVHSESEGPGGHMPRVGGHMPRVGGHMARVGGHMPRVGLRDMHEALTRVTGGIGVANVYVTAIRHLPVPQQLLMATLSTRDHHSRSSSTSSPAARFITPTPSMDPEVHPSPSPRRALDDLQAAHARLCARVGVASYTPGEFATALEMLETTGLVTMRTVGRGVGRTAHVALAVAEGDVSLALKDVPVLKQLNFGL